MIVKKISEVSWHLLGYFVSVVFHVGVKRVEVLNLWVQNMMHRTQRDEHGIGSSREFLDVEVTLSIRWVQLKVLGQPQRKELMQKEWLIRYQSKVVSWSLYHFTLSMVIKLLIKQLLAVRQKISGQWEQRTLTKLLVINLEKCLHDLVGFVVLTYELDQGIIGNIKWLLSCSETGEMRPSPFIGGDCLIVLTSFELMNGHRK